MSSFKAPPWSTSHSDAPSIADKARLGHSTATPARAPAWCAELPAVRSAQDWGELDGERTDERGYALVKSAPEVNPDEVEARHVTAVEVMILWGTNVLHVQHLTPPRAFYVGEVDRPNHPCDYLIPVEKLGATRAPLVLADETSVRCVILPGATGYVETPGQAAMDLRDAIASGRATPCEELAGGYELALPPGAKACIRRNGIVFRVGTVAAGKSIPTGIFATRDPGKLLFTGFSLTAHLGLMGAMAFFVPPLGLTDDEGLQRDRQYLIRQYLQAAAERDAERKTTDAPAESAVDDSEGGSGQRSAGEEGSMGNPTATRTGMKYGIKGPRDNPEPRVAREAALQEAAEIGMIGLLRSGVGGDPNAPTAPWGALDSLGTDPLSARGALWGDEIGEAFGAGGLGLSGLGDGGGGPGAGIGLDSVGTIGHGKGTGLGDGIGRGHGHPRPGHQATGISFRPGNTTITGHLPAEIIQRIVRQNYGRFRVCYENGLRTNPNLQGRVAVRFVIGRDGSVSNVANGGSDLPDVSVVECVIRSYYGLSFPQPESGIVTVVYPILFSPAGG